MYIKKILLMIVVLGLIVGGVFAYKVYDTIFSPNTVFNNEEAIVFIPTAANINDVKDLLTPLLNNPASFVQVAERKGYANNVKGGKYAIQKGNE